MNLFLLAVTNDMLTVLDSIWGIGDAATVYHTYEAEDYMPNDVLSSDDPIRHIKMQKTGSPQLFFNDGARYPDGFETASLGFGFIVNKEGQVLIVPTVTIGPWYSDFDAGILIGDALDEF